jgi:hypothetical protein
VDGSSTALLGCHRSGAVLEPGLPFVGSQIMHAITTIGFDIARTTLQASGAPHRWRPSARCIRSTSIPGLGGLRSPVHQQACWIKNMIVHLMRFQEMVQPEPARSVQSRAFQSLAANWNWLSWLSTCIGADDPTLLAQFDCNQDADSGIITYSRRGGGQTDFRRSILKPQSKKRRLIKG